MINQQEAAQRVIKLRKLLLEHSYKYYVLDSPEINDAVYDGLFAELKQLEKKYPSLIEPTSPTQRVGGEPQKGFKSARHSSRMLSLNDVFDESDIYAWVKRIEKLANNQKIDYFADIKKDGLACALIYENSKLVKALTRGDGYVGEDVTLNVKTIGSVPLMLRNTKETQPFLSSTIEVRGEIVMYKKDFEELNKQRQKQGLVQFANPRNTAAGTIRQLDPKLVANRKLHFLAYDVIVDNKDFIKTNQEAYQLINKLGFSGSQYGRYLSGVPQITKYINEWQNKRDDLPYQIDGLVIKVNNRQLFFDLGIVGKNPRGAIAYKYPAEQNTTTVKDIFVSIGRTGAATPVAILEPIKIAGSTVQMATLHNETEVKRKDIRIGDSVVVQKAGDIIPEVVEPIASLRTGRERLFVMPKKCPECSKILVKQKADEAIWRCPNIACPARAYKQILHFASKAALDIEGLGEKNVIALLNNNLISDAADLYKLTKKQLLLLDRFADKSADNLLQAIYNKKRPSLAKFLYALGIRHIGIQTAIDIANKLKTLAVVRSATTEQLNQIDGVGEVVSEAMVAWFAEPTNQKLLDKFFLVGVKPLSVSENKRALKLKGVNFVITGSLSQSRDVFAEKIRTLGGTFQSSVGNDTTYLVVGKGKGGSKLKKAKKLGTTIIDEDTLLKLLDKY